jgi:hypothetical protein
MEFVSGTTSRIFLGRKTVYKGIAFVNLSVRSHSKDSCSNEAIFLRHDCRGHGSESPSVLLISSVRVF